MRLIAYLRVSTDEQGDSGLGLEAQRADVARYCQASGHQLVRVVREVASARKATTRPGLEEALEAVEAGEADGIIASRLDRFCRSVVQADDILSRLGRAGGVMVALDLGVDTSTPAGRFVMNVLASVAQWERDVISERTTNALAAARSQGTRIGRPVEYPIEVRRRACRMRAEGATFREIADTFTREGIPTARGGAWRPSTLHRIVNGE